MSVSPDFSKFSDLYHAGQPQVMHMDIVAELETPISLLLKIGPEQPFTFLFESVEGGNRLGRYSFITLAPDLIWRCKNGKAEISQDPDDPNGFEIQTREPLASLRQVIKDSAIELPDNAPPMAAGLFGYLGYDMVRYMEKLPDDTVDALDIPDAILCRPTIVAVFDHLKREIALYTPVRPVDGVSAETAYQAGKARMDALIETLSAPLVGAYPQIQPKQDQQKVDAAIGKVAEQISSNTTRERYEEMVETAKAYIRAGDIYQVVPSQRFALPFDKDSFSFYRALRRLNPSPFLFHLPFGEFSVIGSSPEILVGLRDETVTIRPIAGTRHRGRNEAEDRALGEELLADEKERSEHLMLLDLGRNDVSRVAQPGTTTVTQEMVIERYSHVMHIVSNVEGKLDRTAYDALDALIGGFPAGTVSGAPKIRAMEIIEEMEQTKRGLYAGCIGYFGAGGDMDTCIALRTALLKDQQLYVQAGGGVVYDSDADFEYEETRNKAKALMRAAAETLYLVD